MTIDIAAPEEVDTDVAPDMRTRCEVLLAVLLGDEEPEMGMMRTAGAETAPDAFVLAAT